MWPTSGQGGYITPAAWGVPTASERGAASEVAHKWARWLHNQYRLGGPQHFRARGSIRGGPQVGKVATSPLPPWGSPPLQSGEQHQRWPTSEQGGYITPAARAVPTASERGAASEVAHKRARWLHNPCRLRGPRRFRAGGSIRGGPQVGKVATKPLLPGGVPTASERGAASEVAPKWARWLHNPCHLWGPHRFRRGRIRGGPQVGKVAT